jgi:hypothetical protein
MSRNSWCPQLPVPVRSRRDYDALPAGHPDLEFEPGSKNYGVVLIKRPGTMQ